jgi:hypothetical protein
VKLPLAPPLREQIERFQLRFTCDDCAHFDRDGEACAHGYPTEEHRRPRAMVVFCKEFALD